MSIVDHYHGKARVRVAKKTIDPATGMHYFIDFNCEVSTWSPECEKSYTVGNNTMVVATDTCKNTAYVVAKECQFSSPEEFAIAYAERFIEKFDHITKVVAVVKQIPWERAVVEGQPHQHAFVRGSGEERWVARACAVRGAPTVVTSEIHGMTVLKTTQSGWDKFHRNEYTLLPECTERMMASSVTARWECTPSSSGLLPFAANRAAVKTALLATFTGPPDKGLYSPGVQHTLHKMGLAALDAVPAVAQIVLNMPNIHFLPAKLLDAMDTPHKFEDDVFIPTDEPHGTIEATIVRHVPAKL